MTNCKQSENSDAPLGRLKENGGRGDPRPPWGGLIDDSILSTRPGFTFFYILFTPDTYGRCGMRARERERKLRMIKGDSGSREYDRNLVSNSPCS